MRKKVGRDSSACDKERYKIDDEEILCERDLFKLVGDLSWKKGATCLESESDLSYVIVGELSWGRLDSHSL